MMFSDYIAAIHTLLHLPVATLIPLALAFTIVFWLLSGVFRSVVLDGHSVVLAGVGFITASLVAGLLHDGQPANALAFFVPAVLMGKEAYRRLLN